MVKKYFVSVLITKTQRIDYEIEAFSKEQLKQMILDGSIEDYGHPVNVGDEEIICREIGDIKEI